jgi:hypothetical protein
MLRHSNDILNRRKLYMEYINIRFSSKSREKAQRMMCGEGRTGRLIAQDCYYNN